MAPTELSSSEIVERIMLRRSGELSSFDGTAQIPLGSKESFADQLERYRDRLESLSAHEQERVYSDSGAELQLWTAHTMGAESLPSLRDVERFFAENAAKTRKAKPSKVQDAVKELLPTILKELGEHASQKEILARANDRLRSRNQSVSLSTLKRALEAWNER